MTFVFFILGLVIWLNLGILAARSINEPDGSTPLEAMNLPLRLLVILLSPVLLLIYDRHLFYSDEEECDN